MRGGTGDDGDGGDAVNHVVEQAWIPGIGPTEPQIPEIDQALDAWLEAKVEQKRAADTTKIRHATLVEAVTAAGIERYAYVDRDTGKRRYVYPDKTPRMRTKAAPRKRDREIDVGDEVVAPKPNGDAGGVEQRRVPRASVEREIDGFAATRAAMKPIGGGSVLDEARGTPSKPNGKSKTKTQKKAKR